MARGSIRQRTPGSWTLIYDLPRGPSGRRRQAQTTIKGTRREAERMLAKLIHEADTGQVGDARRQTVAQYLERWLRDSAALDLAPQTLAGYRVSVRRWCGVIGGTRLDRLTGQDLQAAIRTLADSGLAAGTVRTALIPLRRALRQAVEWGLLARDPSAHLVLPRLEPRERHTLTPQEAVAVLAAAHQDGYGLVVILALGLGLRTGEILALRWQDVDLDAGTVRVSRSQQRDRVVKGTKSGRARVVTIPAFVLVALREAWERRQGERRQLGSGWNRDDLLFCSHDGAPVTIAGTEIMRRICRAAAVPYVSLHGLRHSHTTLLIDAGADVKAVSERLGHSNVSITLNVYRNLTPAHQQALAQDLDRLLR